MRQPFSVAVYPVRTTDGKGEYLLLRRVPRPDLALGDFWQGITGGFEEGEDLVGAAMRELTEETKLVPSALEQVDCSHSFPVHDKWQWCSLEQALGLLTYPGNIKALKHCDSLVRTRLDTG
jgi:8-oxo-dGTP pyrophosphatase MutT (NUDIX family)